MLGKLAFAFFVSLLGEKICMFVAFSDPIFHSVFAIDFLPGLSFGFVTNPKHLILQILRITASFGTDFLFSLRKSSLFGHM